MADSNIWGPLVWDWLLAVGDVTSDLARDSHFQHRLDFSEHAILLEHVLPCRYCRDSLAIINRHFPPTLCVQSSSPALSPIYWTFFVHNVVNRKLGKPLFPMRSVVRRLATEPFRAQDCARMVFYMSIWARVHCRGDRAQRIFARWLQCVLRLARRVHRLGAFNDAFEDWPRHGPPRDPLAHLYSLHERLARVLNTCADPPLGVAAYRDRFARVLPEAGAPVHRTSASKTSRGRAK